MSVVQYRAYPPKCGIVGSGRDSDGANGCVVVMTTTNNAFIPPGAFLPVSDSHRPTTFMERLYFIDDTMRVADQSESLEAVLFAEWIPRLQEQDYYNYITERIEPVFFNLYSFRSGSFSAIANHQVSLISRGHREYLLAAMTIGKATLIPANIINGAIVVGSNIASFLHHRPQFKSVYVSGVPTDVELADPQCFGKFQYIVNCLIMHNPYVKAEIANPCKNV